MTLPRSPRALAVALAGGLIVTGAAPALAAVPAAVTVTIQAKSAVKPVTGDVLVVFRSNLSKATISGTVTGAASGNVAELFSQQFPFKHKAAKAGSVTLGASPASYSFTVQPGLATRYTVEVFKSASAAKPLATSATTTVYLVDSNYLNRPQRCKRPVCTEKFTIRTFAPASARDSLAREHWYVYFAVNLSRHGVPPYPKWLSLDGKASVSKPQFPTVTEFVQKITFSFRINNDGYAWLWNLCQQDNESKTGVGLPGRHSCGSKRIRSTVGYLG